MRMNYDLDFAFAVFCVRTNIDEEDVEVITSVHTEVITVHTVE